MSGVRLCDVTPAQLPLFEEALRNLARDLDDPYQLGSEALHHALFARYPSACGAIARSSSGDLLGASLFSPLVSTARGCPGAYVSDLWVAEPARGQRIGRVLLEYVAERAGQIWNAQFIRLMVYDTNIKARRFYERLGFEGRDDEIILTITGHKLETIGSST